MISFTLPGEPLGVNALYRSVVVRRRMRVLKSAPGRDYEAALIAAARSARGTAPTTKRPVAVRIAIFFGSERPDIDGPIKPILDALQAPGKPKPGSKRQPRMGAGVYKNDRQVTRLFVERNVDPGNPRVEVYVVELPRLIAERPAALRELFDAPAPPVPMAGGQVRLLVSKVRSFA